MTIEVLVSGDVGWSTGSSVCCVCVCVSLPAPESRFMTTGYQIRGKQWTAGDQREEEEEAEDGLVGLTEYPLTTTRQATNMRSDLFPFMSVCRLSLNCF